MRHYCPKCMMTQNFTKTDKEETIKGKLYVQAFCDFCHYELYFRKKETKRPKQKVWQ